MSKCALTSMILLALSMAVHAQQKPPKEGDDWWSKHMGGGEAKKPKPQTPKARCEARAKDKQGQARIH